MVDQMSSAYDVTRNTLRWPMVLFGALLNIGGINTKIVYNLNNGNDMNRNDFLRNLSLELITPLKQIQNQSLATPLSSVSQPLAKRKCLQGRCKLCPRNTDRKIRSTCNSCNSFVCKDHYIKVSVCNSCAQQSFDSDSD